MFTPEQISHITSVKQKLREFHESCCDQLWGAIVSGYYRNSPFISGGAIASLLQGETPNDYDYYFGIPPFSDVVKWSEKYSDHIMDSVEYYRLQGGNPDPSDTGTPLVSENAITMRNTAQIIYRLHGTPSEIKSTFDYVHCTPHYDVVDDTLYISKQQYDCCVNKMLVINNKDRVTSHRREKFKKRGYI